jgi:hypothetical protein
VGTVQHRISRQHFGPIEWWIPNISANQQKLNQVFSQFGC